MGLVVSVVGVIAAAAVVLAFAGLGRASRSGVAPGLANGRLTRCPASPNCIASEHADDERHFAEPIALDGAAADRVMNAALEAIAEMNGTVVRSDPQYIAATFSSRLFGFVDDFELRLDPEAAVLQVRSASRVGYGDMGVNRDRVERFRARIAEKL